ncbi:uncharacterized protein LOC119103216 [Pollicipes pollicipes]|uniref:uncharacterized protein LOC119103216 n=1 Tax=Pollicipes pollicipes TaxID=41117 RepID=UPI001884AA7B|nr:uncharacterized protein LOC119103216 [Pollicipes pollicipes]
MVVSPGAPASAAAPPELVHIDDDEAKKRRSSEREKERPRDKDREKGRSRDRDREREREKERSREEREKGRSRDHGRSRSRSRERDRSEGRRRSGGGGFDYSQPRAGRVRRFIYFPSGSTVTVTVDFVIPVGSSGASITFSPSITFVPTTITRHEYGSHEGRSFAADRSRLLDTVGDAFRQVGLDGRACLQRLMCEVSGAPRHRDGLLGEVVNTVLLGGDSADNEVGTETGTEVALFSNSTRPAGDGWSSQLFDAEELAEARMHGSFHGDCSERYGSCPVSIFNII